MSRAGALNLPLALPGVAVSASRSPIAYVLTLTLTVVVVSCQSSTEVCDAGDALCGTPDPSPTTPVATTVTLSPPSVSFSSLGESRQIAATVTDQDGQAMANALVTWSSSLASVASVSSSGLVVAGSNGGVTITATSGTVTGTATVAVQQVAASITATPNSIALIGAGATAMVAVSVLDAGGSVVVDPDLAWSSDDEAVATVDVNGLVAAVAGGAATITVDATAGGSTVQDQVVVTVSDLLQITTTSLPNGVPAVAYSETLTAIGADGNYTWSLTGGSLPTGLSLNTSTGGISGTPTQVETQTFTIEVMSGDGQTDSQQLTIDVNTTLSVFTTTLPSGISGVTYNETIVATGGDGSYSWALAAGSGPLPTGLNLAASGDIVGTPTTAGTSNFTVEVTSGGQTAQRALSLTVHGMLSVTTTSLPNGTPTVAYSETLIATGGDGAYTWSIPIGSLPTGLSLNTSTGGISGTPTQVETQTFTIEVMSGDGQTDSQQLTITVATTIAFSTTRHGGFEVYTMDADGTNEVRLTNRLGLDLGTAWSPDYEKIAFSSDRDGNSEVWVMGADGSNPTALTNTVGANSEPEWSPDGSKIAFQSLRDGNSEIYVMEAPSGANQLNLTNAVAGDWSADWSPDGSKIAFLTDRDGNNEIYVMDTDGANLVNLTSAGSVEWDPTWSPDGSKIAFSTDRDGNFEVYVMDADGSNLLRLTTNAAFDWEPTWSPDGSKIAFATNRDGNFEIYVMNADGSNVTRLTNNTSDERWPAWAR